MKNIQSEEELLNYLTTIVSEKYENSLKSENKLTARVKRDIKQIVREIHKDDSPIMVAIRSSRLNILQVKTNMHAEMVVLNMIFDTNFKFSGYLGISKLCCAKCFVAINYHYNRITENVIRVCGCHGKTSNPSWSIPSFIFDEELLMGQANKLKNEIEHTQSDRSSDIRLISSSSDDCLNRTKTEFTEDPYSMIFMI